MENFNGLSLSYMQLEASMEWGIRVPTQVKLFLLSLLHSCILYFRCFMALVTIPAW